MCTLKMRTIFHIVFAARPRQTETWHGAILALFVHREL
jgi:hypothetical protein